MMSITAGLSALPLGLDPLRSGAKSGGPPQAQIRNTASVSAGAASSATPWQQGAQQALATLKQITFQHLAMGNRTGSQGLASMNRVASEIGDAPRQAAKVNLARLKAQLASLMMMGGDPKIRAEKAAEIAKEIGKAAKEYAAAGGVSASTTTAVASAGGSVGATASAANAATAESDASGATTALAATTAAPQDSLISTSSAAATGAASDASSTVAPTVAAPQDTVASTGSAASATASTATSAAVAATPAGASGSSSQAASTSPSSEDKEFIKEARNLARQAKAILQQAIAEVTRQKQRTHARGDEGDKALAEIDKAAAGLGLGTPGADSSAGYDAHAQAVEAVPGPAVSVRA